MKYFAQILTLFFYVMGVQADCQITKNMVENTKRIFTYRNARGAVALLRTERVPHGMKLYMVCTERDVVETQCQDNGRFTEPLPMSCDEPMKPSVMQGRDSHCTKTLYIVGYMMQGQQLELFRTCYDRPNGRALYSQSDVHYKSYIPMRQMVDFEMDQIITPAQAAAYKKGKIYAKFKRIFGNTQTYVPNPLNVVINRGHLVASADFLFADQMVSTFRYINVVPQFKSINDGNWKRIENWVRSRVNAQKPYRIRTGAIDDLSLRDQNGNLKRVSLYDSTLNVPKWIYKSVFDTQGNGIYVFLSYNNIFESRRPPPPSTCQPVECPLILENNPNDGFIFCCNPTNFRY
ncbi:uncharacterized protein LOC111604815 [Drosophila hydei]|uniref:Uncharacterized protein LOC111604815 n=1 Tax=Drosophila hydei TaxID=7224 RepID=A0A6J1MBU7_DROHY|nr:uncharacterized protein LOC111604815 [Drosophila hydei]